MKKCSPSLVNRDMQIKTAMRYYTPIRKSEIKKTGHTKCQWGCGATGIFILMGM